MKRIDYVIVDVDSNDSFSVKLCRNDDSFTEGGVVYGSNILYETNLNGDVAKSELGILDFMSLAEGLTKTVKTVTFKLKEPSPVVANDGSFTKSYKDKGNNNPIATQRYSASAAHEKDSVEIFIDENNEKTKSYQEDDKQYRVNYLNEHTFNGVNCVEDNITSNVTLTEDGYVMEIAIK